LPDRKYFKTFRPSRAGNGSPHATQAISRSAVSGPASVSIKWYDATQFGQLNCPVLVPCTTVCPHAEVHQAPQAYFCRIAKLASTEAKIFSHWCGRRNYSVVATRYRSDIDLSSSPVWRSDHPPREGGLPMELRHLRYFVPVVGCLLNAIGWRPAVKAEVIHGRYETSTFLASARVRQAR